MTKENKLNLKVKTLYSDLDNFESVNVFLLKHEDEFLLIDSAFSSKFSEENLFSFLEQNQVNLSKLKVFITHNHPDHIGGASFLARNGAKIYMNQDEKDVRALICKYYELGKAFSLDFLHTYGFNQNEASLIYENTQKKAYHYHDYDFDLSFYDLPDFFALGDKKLDVISLKGHTKAQCGLVDKEQNRIFTADAIGQKDVFLVSSLFFNQNQLDLEFMTYDKLLKFCDYTCFPSHGNEFNTIEQSVINGKNYYQKLIKRVKNAINCDCHTIKQISTKVFSYKENCIENDESRRLHYRLANVVSCLDYLLQHKKITLQEDNKIIKIFLVKS